MFPGLSELCKSGLMLLVSYGMYGLLGAFEKPNYSANPHNHNYLHWHEQNLYGHARNTYDQMQSEIIIILSLINGIALSMVSLERKT